MESFGGRRNGAAELPFKLSYAGRVGLNVPLGCPGIALGFTQQTGVKVL